jgi:transcriptional regulator with GAF, ATPase, and Fis domain
MPLDGVLSIGRDEHTTLSIPDPSLSRRHCAIDAADHQVVLRDLSSKNGVFVNGCPVTERRLADGDVIRIGGSALLVLMPNLAGSPGKASRVGMVDTPAESTTTVAMGSAASRYLDAGPGAEREVGSARRDLEVLLRLSAALQGVTSANDLYELVLSHALDATDADAAAVLAPGPDDQLMVVAGSAPPGTKADVNRVVAARALAENAAILAADTSSLCAPLAVTGTAPTAVLCLSGPGPKARLTDQSLPLVAAIGALGGLALERVQHLDWLRAENERLRIDAVIEHNLVGESAAMARVHRFISRVAATDATVLLRGESGTGKELVASAIHRNSARAHGPFVAINCAALPEALLESELFGHERGAFTGAVTQQRGRLELAHGGTVFLDEIAELKPALQAKLLRVLQDRVVERLGARRGTRIDVRVIAATNRDLEASLKTGAFRDDLYYRLNVVSLSLPTLRERRDDLPLLASYFVRHHANSCKRPVTGISPAARNLLMAYDWPGNVRELSNAIERAVVLGSQDTIQPEDLPENLLEAATPSNDRGFHGLVADKKREVIRQALDKAGGNIAQAARDLRLQPTYLHRLIKNLAVTSG